MSWNDVRLQRGVSPASPAPVRGATLLVSLLCLCLGLAQPVRAESCAVAAGLEYCLYPGPEPTLVLLSGLGNAMDSWPPSFLRALNQLAGVLTYNRKGYGRSDAAAASVVTALETATDLDALLAQLGLEQVVLVGHSLGGLYAQFLVRHQPSRVVAVVLLDASSPFEPLDNPRFRTRAQLTPHSIDYLESRGIDASVALIRRSPSSPPIPWIVISATEHGGSAELEAEWQRIQAATATQSPRGRHVVARGSGHDLARDQPALVIEEIRKLLQQLRSVPSPGS